MLNNGDTGYQKFAEDVISAGNTNAVDFADIDCAVVALKVAVSIR